MKIKELFAETYSNLKSKIYKDYSKRWNYRETNPYQIAIALDRQYTIRALEELFYRLGESQVTLGRVLEFKAVLTERAKRVIGTDRIYMHATSDPLNRLCEKLAEELVSSLLIRACKLKLLLPMIETKNDMDLVDLDESEAESDPDDRMRMHEYVLGDDDKTLINVYDCLAASTEDGKLKHTNTLANGKTKYLSATESMRVIGHSLSSRMYHESIQQLYKIKNEGQNVGAAIKRLIEKLEAGGERRGGGTAGSAGPVAIEGIREFYHVVCSLSAEQKSTLFMAFATNNIIASTFAGVWLRLLRRFVLCGYGGIELSINDVEDIALYLGNVVDDMKQFICVEQAASDFSRILSHHQELFDLYPENIELSIATSINFYVSQVETSGNRVQNELRRKYLMVSSSYGDEGRKRFMKQAYQNLITTVPDLQWAMKDVIGFVDIVGKNHINGIIKNGDDVQQILKVLTPEQATYFLNNVLETDYAIQPPQRNRHVYFFRSGSHKRRREEEVKDHSNERDVRVRARY